MTTKHFKYFTVESKVCFALFLMQAKIGVCIIHMHALHIVS